MKKHISVVLALVFLLGAFAVPVSASGTNITYEEEIIYVEGLGNVTVKTVISEEVSMFRSSTRSTSKIKTYEYNGSKVASVTLKATFGYDGSEAWVISASGSHTTYNGWSYSGQYIDKDGDTVTLTADLDKSPYDTVPVEVTLTCSPSGTIR